MGDVSAFAHAVARYLEEQDTTIKPLPDLVQHARSVQVDTDQDKAATHVSRDVSSPTTKRFIAGDIDSARHSQRVPQQSDSGDRPLPATAAVGNSQDSRAPAQAAPAEPERVVVINNNNNNNSGGNNNNNNNNGAISHIGAFGPLIGGRNQRETDEDDDNKTSANNNAYLGAAFLAIATLGLAFGATKMLLAHKRQNDLVSKAQSLSRDETTETLLDRCDETLGCFCRRDRIYTASVFSGGSSAIAASLLYYFNHQSRKIYFPLVGISCLAASASLFSYMWYNDSSVNKSHQLHNECRRICERPE